jgi:hypothetical protein
MVTVIRNFSSGAQVFLITCLMAPSIRRNTSNVYSCFCYQRFRGHKCSNMFAAIHYCKDGVT